MYLAFFQIHNLCISHLGLAWRCGPRAPGGERGVGLPLIELAEADLSDARRAPAHLAAEAAPENDMQDESEEAAARADGEGEQVPVGDGGVQQATNQGTRTSRARPLSLQGGPVRAP